MMMSNERAIYSGPTRRSAWESCDNHPAVFLLQAATTVCQRPPSYCTYGGVMMRCYPLFTLLLVAVTAISNVDYLCLHKESWRTNSTSFSKIMNSYTDVNSLYLLSDKTSVKAYFTMVPSYAVNMTSIVITSLISRPKASSDFRASSAPYVKTNIKYDFAADIGYKTADCKYGFWPPGPSCPSAQDKGIVFTLNPAKESSASGCWLQNSNIGYFVNGVGLFSFTDTKSFSSKDTWHQLAMEFEKFDMDICSGHAAMGEYHHHSNSPCLSESLDDIGNSHSPVYGFIVDGFPIYGPYNSGGVLATSCWQKRDYSSSKYGCSGGARTCVFADSTNPSKGTTALSTTLYGPSTTSTLTTMSGNSITASSGVYFEDYFFNSTCYNLGGEHLNENNGHDHDGLGFHYHLTQDSKGAPVFPYSVGPKYYGCLPTTQICGCSLPTSAKPKPLPAQRSLSSLGSSLGSLGSSLGGRALEVVGFNVVPKDTRPRADTSTTATKPPPPSKSTTPPAAGGGSAPPPPPSGTGGVGLSPVAQSTCRSTCATISYSVDNTKSSSSNSSSSSANCSVCISALSVEDVAVSKVAVSIAADLGAISSAEVIVGITIGIVAFCVLCCCVCRRSGDGPDALPVANDTVVIGSPRGEGKKGHPAWAVWGTLASTRVLPTADAQVLTGAIVNLDDQQGSLELTRRLKKPTLKIDSSKSVAASSGKSGVSSSGKNTPLTSGRRQGSEDEEDRRQAVPRGGRTRLYQTGKH